MWQDQSFRSSLPLALGCVLLILQMSCATAPVKDKGKGRRVGRSRPPVTAPVAAPVDEDGEPADRKPFAPQEGLASFYANSLAGNLTANGETYRPEKATCAHRSASFGTWLRVTVVETGRSAVCRVNDRGPFVKDRIVDLSRFVAEQVGMVDQGVVRVRIEATEAP